MAALTVLRSGSRRGAEGAEKTDLNHEDTKDTKINPQSILARRPFVTFVPSWLVRLSAFSAPLREAAFNSDFHAMQNSCIKIVARRSNFMRAYTKTSSQMLRGTSRVVFCKC